MGTFTVLDASGNPQSVTNNANGRQAAADSAPIALSTEDLASVDAITTAVEAGAIGVGTAGTPDADVLSIQGISNMTPVVTGGNVANDAADSGNPQKIGGKATTSLTGGTNVAAGDRVDAAFAVDGSMLVRTVCLENITSGVAAITDGSSTSVISAAGAGVKIYITSVIIANSSSTNVTVDLRDGTGGTVKATIPAPANAGAVTNLPVPLPFSANTAVAADPSAAASTVTVTLLGFTSKI